MWRLWRLTHHVVMLGLLAVMIRSEFTCPEECSCRAVLEPSLLRVTCARGAMQAIPIDFLDRQTNVLVISAPPARPNHLTIGPIFTQPTPFTDLSELHIVNSNIPSIGQYPFWGLQNLRVINLMHNNLTAISADNFRGLINLTELNLDHNRIEQMPSESFRHLTSLKTLILSNNRIITLVPRLFRRLSKLFYLDLSYNPLDDLRPEVFKDIQHLRVFRCRRCLLQRVNTQIYHLVPHLEELDLGENQFKYLTSDEFVSLKKLKKVKLDGNQLSVLVDNLFARNRDLRVLSLARNRLALLAPASLTNLTMLTQLDISHNKIDRFHLQTFSPVLESLRIINFSGNNLPLSEIATVLQILPNVSGVGLANLSLQEIPSSLFAYNEHLISLDLSWNEIMTFPFGLLARTMFLQRLDLSRNKLETLDEQDLGRLEGIAHINLTENRWRCDQCSAGAMTVFMLTTVLNRTIRQVKCHSPMRLHGVSFGDLSFDQLAQCPSTHEAQVSMIAGLMLLCVAILAAVTATVCCARRRAAHYYTNEEKRRQLEQHSDELIERTELPRVATIHAPYYLVAKGR